MLLNCGAGEDSKSPLDCKEIKLVNPKGNQPWIYIGRTGAEAEAPILWPPDEKRWLIRKDSDAAKDWRQEEKRTLEDEMVRWHQWLSGHEFEQTPGDCEGQGSLVCCSSWAAKSWTQLSDWTTTRTEPPQLGMYGLNDLIKIKLLEQYLGTWEARYLCKYYFCWNNFYLTVDSMRARICKSFSLCWEESLARESCPINIWVDWPQASEEGEWSCIRREAPGTVLEGKD